MIIPWHMSERPASVLFRRNRDSNLDYDSFLKVQLVRFVELGGCIDLTVDSM